MTYFFFRHDWLDGRRLSFTVDRDSEAPTWRKVLYERQDMDDNYTSESVLELLASRCDSESPLTFRQTVERTASICQHISMIVLFVLIWHALRWSQMTVPSLLLMDVVLMVIGYRSRDMLLNRLLQEEISVPCSPKGPITETLPNGKRYLRDAISAVYAFGTLLILSPVLRTLTMSWSEDTIYAMTVILLFTHAIVHDYGYIYRERDAGEKLHDNLHDLSRVWRQVDNTLSLNAAMFAAVILASRLDTVTHVFAFIFLAITGFMMLPTAQKCVYMLNPTFYNKHMTLITIAFTEIVLLCYGGGLLGALYAVCIFFVAIVCPFLFVKCHSLRTELKGPWDIAHVEAARIEFTPLRKRRNSGFL